jgi:glutamate racemase
MIGVFDSGVGGLTAVSAFDRLMPQCDIVYFGDTARVPYGTKSKAVIEKYAFQDCRFLLSEGVKAILAACGTVSSNCLNELKEALEVPVTGVVEPAAKKAYETASRSNRTIAVLGTSATVRSGAYEREIRKYGDFTKIISVACPLFVSLVENGRVGADDAIANIAVREYLASIIPLSPSAVILGCTHYPLLSEVIAKYLPESELINASEEAVKSLCSLVGEDDVVCGRSGARRFYVSDDPEGFAESGRAFLGHDISDRVNYVNIEEF